MITDLVAKLPQATHGRQLFCGLKRGTEEYNGTTGSFPNGLINLFGKLTTGTLAVDMVGISRAFVT
jgi:hypothetical protein